MFSIHHFIKGFLEGEATLREEALIWRNIGMPIFENCQHPSHFMSMFLLDNFRHASDLKMLFSAVQMYHI